MKQAYDYWQDQPGNFCMGMREESSTLSQAVVGRSITILLFDQSKQQQPSNKEEELSILDHPSLEWMQIWRSQAIDRSIHSRV